MQNKRLILVRLEKEQKQLQKEPIPNILVRRKGVLDFHFCIYGLESPYKGGFYHGVLELSQDYPFAPPKLRFFTPSGRFQTSKPICTTFTDFHKQSWSSAWNVRTMLLGTISFMTGGQGGYGSMSSSSSSKEVYAKNSLSHNMNNPEFVQLFKEEIISRKLFSITQNNERKESEPAVNADGSNALYVILAIVLMLWVFKDQWIDF